MRNKVASVAVGRCAVTEVRCLFAALFAQVYVLLGRNAARLIGGQDAALPGRRAAMRQGRSPAMPHRQRHGTSHAGHAARPLGYCATLRSNAATRPPPHGLRIGHGYGYGYAAS